MARNQVAKKSVSNDGKIVLTFSNQTVLDFDPSTVSDETRKKAMEHGFLQKIGDSYAGVKTVEDAIANAKGVIDSLNANDWNQRREAGEGPDTGLLLEAIMRVNQIPEEKRPAIQEKLKATPAAEKTVLRAMPAIVAEIGKIKLERAEKKSVPETAADLLTQFA